MVLCISFLDVIINNVFDVPYQDSYFFSLETCFATDHVCPLLLRSTIADLNSAISAKK